ncbi:hypothetical protein UACE39S_00971 [Ureibacillus acetophenoni]
MKSKSGVLINTNFRDSLIIDRYSSEFKHWRGLKLEHLKSENSEDAMTWNVFRSLKQINPNSWLPNIFVAFFQREFQYSTDFIDIHLWKRLDPPKSYKTPEGASEVDIIIESDEFVWIIEAKYKSDISISTTHDSNRNQVIRNIDVGLEYVKEKDLYFSLLVLDEKHSPKGLTITNEYSNSFNRIMDDLPHRNHELSRLNGVGVLTWTELLEVFDGVVTKDELERVIVNRAYTWLSGKILNPVVESKENNAIFDETKTYRYSLSRVWDSNKEKVVFILLNPSIADERKDDPTLLRCIDYAKRWSNEKYGSLEIVNLFAYRSTDKSNLKLVNDPVGKDNDQYIINAVKDASLVVVAWGENGTYKNRDKEVLKLLTEHNINPYCLEILSEGQPKHPLYAKGSLKPKPYIY